MVSFVRFVNGFSCSHNCFCFVLFLSGSGGSRGSWCRCYGEKKRIRRMWIIGYAWVRWFLLASLGAAEMLGI